ncbi:MAG: hypothetical protein R3B54_11315, partial [Bdellovibrionota bacterium]
MRLFSGVAIFLLSLAQAGVAQDVSDVLSGIVSDGVNRFQVAGEPKCSNGYAPLLSKFVQYRSKKQGEWEQWSTGPARNYAPYLWFARTEAGVQIYLTSM